MTVENPIGKEVREAYDGPRFEHDQLVTHLENWKSAESSRASGAAETRQEIGQFIETTGLNKKALAVTRALDKMPEDKRADTLRSLDLMLESLRPMWDGQQTPDMLDGAPPVEDGDDIQSEPQDDVVQHVDFGGDDGDDEQLEPETADDFGVQTAADKAE